MRKFFLAACLALFAVAPLSAPAEASERKKIAAQFDALWQQRLAEYRTSAASTAVRHKSAVDAILTGKPFTFASDDVRLKYMIDASQADATVGGRGQELEAFLAHMKSKPSLGLIEAYLQGRIQKAQEAQNAAEALKSELSELIKRPDAKIGDVLVAVEGLAMARGDVIGRADELTLLIQNFNAYSGDIAIASEQDRQNRARWAAALGAMGRSMQQQQTPTVLTSCMATGPFVNCTSH